jgi:hypothetical protein
VSGQIAQALLDVHFLGPDAPAHQGVVVVGQVHETGEVFAQSDGVDNGEVHASGRQGREQAGHGGLQGRDGGAARLGAGLHEQRAAIGQFENGRDVGRR